MTTATRTSLAKHPARQESAARVPARAGRASARGRGEGRSPSAIASQAAAEAVVEALIATPCHPLDPGDRSKMEASFGETFTDVRVHRDGQSGDFAADLRADAFTLGQHVFFGHGRYRPGTPE